MQTTEEFLTKHPHIDVQITEVDNRPEPDHWPEGSRHFRTHIVNKRSGYGMTVTYSQGPGIDEEPTPGNIVSSLAVDAICLADMPTFEAYAHDTGVDPDSRQWEATYDRACREIANLRLLLGEDTYEELINDTEHDWE